MKVGYIGLGALGGALARRLPPHHELRVWDLDPAAIARCEQAGARAAASPAELARACEIIVLCLPRSSDVRQVLFGPGGLAEGLAPGQLVIDQTSGIPAETRAMAQQLAERGVAMLDAAVSGSPHITAQGGATLMVGGPSDLYERALPVLRVLAGTIHRCGPRVGDGQAMKMVNNAMNAGCRLGTLELAAMGRKAGLALETMAAVLNTGGARNLTTERMLPAIAEGKASTQFALSLMLKDLNQAVNLGMETGVPMPVTGTVRALLQMGVNLLGPQSQLEDMIGFTESMAGTRLPGEPPAQPPPATAPAARLAIGFVGLGDMGGALAARLLQSHPLQVFDRDPQAVARLVQQGATAAADLGALARSCDVVFLCLPTSADVRSVLFGPGGLAEGLAAGKLVVDQTSGDPEETRALAAQLQAQAVALVDAPVSGGPSGAAAGTIAIMAGGVPAAFGRVRAVLEAISPNVVYCGGIGNGHVMKLVNNGVSSLCRLVTYECVAAGLKYGLRLRDLATVLHTSSGWSAASRRLLPALLAGQQTSAFQLQLMVKDLRLAARLGMACGAPLPLASAVRCLFEAGANQYGGSASVEDMARLYEAMAAFRFEPEPQAGAR